MYRVHWAAQGGDVPGGRIYEERICEGVQPEHEVRNLVVEVTTGGYLVHDEQAQRAERGG